MATSYNASMVTDSLALYLDTANVKRNASSVVLTNLIQGGAFFNGQNSPQESGSSPTNTIVLLENPGDSPYVLRQNGNNAEYQLNINSGMLANTPYVMSGWYTKSSDYNSVDTMFHARAHSSSGAHVATGVGIGSLIYSVVVNGITWEYRYLSFTTPSDFNNDFDWYLGYGANNTTGFRYYTNLKVEVGTYPSLPNLSSTYNSAVVVNGPTYNSSNLGSLSFNGISNKLTLTTPTNNSQSQSYELWCSVSLPAGNDGYGYILHNNSANNSLGASAFSIGIKPTNTYFGAFNGGFSTMDSGITASQSTVVQIAITWDGATQKLYMNGQLVDSQALAGTLQNLSTTTSIGNYSVSDYRPVQGKIYAVRSYTKALSDSEVAKNFGSLRGRYGL